ncbi:TPA: hypothetical protein ACMDQP_003095 [Vibrio cholerae]
MNFFNLEELNQFTKKNDKTICFAALMEMQESLCNYTLVADALALYIRFGGVSKADESLLPMTQAAVNLFTESYYENGGEVVCNTDNDKTIYKTLVDHSKELLFVCVALFYAAEIGVQLTATSLQNIVKEHPTSLQKLLQALIKEA